MEKKEVQECRNKLLMLRERLSDEMRHIGEEAMNKSLRDASGDLSAHSVHMADAAIGSFEREVSLGRASGDQEMLYKIDTALQKIDAGEYGVCEGCEKKIVKERLKAIPYAQYCRDCQEQREPRRR